jgi:alpha-1,2-rhamnosyltransferase
MENDPYFLVVGSIEPRKNHQTVLDAFELLWQEGRAANLVIVGGNGWKSEAFIQRVQRHPLSKKRLFLLRRATDAELMLLYSKTTALIIASIAEGFGLPIVEALQRGTKVICSDIPVFREIVGEHAAFFEVTSPEALAKAVAQSIDACEPSPSRSGTPTMQWLTWRESAEQLFSRVVKCTA